MHKFLIIITTTTITIIIIIIIIIIIPQWTEDIPSYLWDSDDDEEKR